MTIYFVETRAYVLIYTRFVVLDALQMIVMIENLSLIMLQISGLNEVRRSFCSLVTFHN